MMPVNINKLKRENYNKRMGYMDNNYSTIG